MICMKCIYHHIYSFITVDVFHLVIRLSDVKKSSVMFFCCFFLFCFLKVCWCEYLQCGDALAKTQPLLSPGVLT